MSDANPKARPRRQARELFRRAYHAQMQGSYEEAQRLYRASIALHPTAEAHTFLGWTHSFRKEYESAIACCLEAVAVDPGFGNPYNDIGAYLIEVGRWTDAGPWLRAAIRAPRYKSYHFPLFNLGRLHEHLGDLDEAERHYRWALRVAPRYRPARTAIRQLAARRN